jgi:hypothetical protein
VERPSAHTNGCSGDACAVERAADALHRARIDPELFGNDAHTGPPRRRQGLTDSFFECRGNWRAPEAFTLTSGPRKAGTDSFRNHRTLKFGKNPHQLKHGLTDGSAPRTAAITAQQGITDRQTPIAAG